MQSLKVHKNQMESIQQIYQHATRHMSLAQVLKKCHNMHKRHNIHYKLNQFTTPRQHSIPNANIQNKNQYTSQNDVSQSRKFSYSLNSQQFKSWTSNRKLPFNFQTPLPLYQMKNHSNKNCTNTSIQNQQQKRTMFIRTEETPNPSSLKFYPTDFKVLDEENYPDTATMDFSSPLKSYSSPLAKAIFQVDGVRGVFLSRNFITVTIDDPERWFEVKLDIFTAIKNFYESGRPVLTEDARPSEDTLEDEDDDEVIIAIKEILETRIRPMVQEDGGDVLFRRFDDDTGTVYLKLQGSCSSCPSSTETLRHGITNMLMHYVPEVDNVEQEFDEVDEVSHEQLRKTEEKIKDQN